jgi:hypothetical protein
MSTTRNTVFETPTYRVWAQRYLAQKTLKCSLEQACSEAALKMRTTRFPNFNLDDPVETNVLVPWGILLNCFRTTQCQATVNKSGTS